jgi:hypothetical protein
MPSTVMAVLGSMVGGVVLPLSVGRLLLVVTEGVRRFVRG